LLDEMDGEIYVSFGVLHSAVVNPAAVQNAAAGPTVFEPKN
jgi:hypothetical protein